MKNTSIWVGIVSFLILLPLFFINYRLTVFETLPHDDYHSVLLYWDGKLPNFHFFAPTCYRFFTFMVAFFWYKCLPFIPLSQTPEGLAIEFVKAKQALAFTAFLCSHLFFCLTWKLVYVRYKKDMLLSLAVATSFLLVSFWMYHHGNDPMYLFYTTLLLYFVERIGVFAVLMLFSVVVNEKIALIFLTYFGLMCFNKVAMSKWIYHLMVSLFTFGLYFVMKLLLKYPGYENQTDLTLFFERVKISIPFIFSIKGFYMNILPLLGLILLSFKLKKENIFKNESVYFSNTIVFLPPIFWMIGVFACSDYGIGRAALLTLPFFILPVTDFLYKANQRLIDTL
jgi:hypothetical protein